MTRAQSWTRLRERPEIDVLVIGGGINGISVFRELALNGVDVVLAEKSDFCSGASAALSRMVHGGLRYLENGEFKLVRESLLERDRLLRNAPHYVKPLPTTVPIFDRFSGLTNSAFRFLGLTRKPSRRGALVIKTGLVLYDLFTGGRRAMPRHEFRSRRETMARWPAINPSLCNSATYYDAWVSHPERLGMEMLRDTVAECPGAVAINYARVERGGEGLVLHDELGGEAYAIAPKLIINATGGWIDLTNAAIGSAQHRIMGGTKGSHLVITNRALFKALDGHMIYYENEDGRICILFPYLGNVLVGSTDIRTDDPESVRCEPDERAYILQSLGFVFPDIEIADEDIIFQFAGVRPLPASDDKVTGRIPRDHFCEVIEGDVPVVCMVGGKWTTFRSFGAMAADLVLDRLGRARFRDTETLAIGGGRDFPVDADNWVAALCARYDLDRAVTQSLFERYGTEAENVAGFMVAGPDVEVGRSGYWRRELLYLIGAEHVETLADLLLRRTAIGISGRLSLGVIDVTLDLLGMERGWPADRRAVERADFLALLARNYGLDEATLLHRDSEESPLWEPRKSA
ncbi:glycerol-3-phosphate dehydrogenase/oxidase [Devosia neptuniae]|uniref:Glycerol-3-phosphate dehydrogenase/oxidase n=1 Tax=Devosia neptuniae TaxID=191302 RepID=A0ABY6CAH0_9HYPH|nr:glycerol-3-phosphate dehydrogenase/oxidase [Devosia neptuniae]UXN69249.1 glycerol-3-phosphate dehydrogenase/oxidase [Devosia neptuniae]